jgi:hypothetical protein
MKENVQPSFKRRLGVMARITPREILKHVTDIKENTLSEILSKI